MRNLYRKDILMRWNNAFPKKADTYIGEKLPLMCLMVKTCEKKAEKTEEGKASKKVLCHCNGVAPPVFAKK
ncbi:MAG: hypothetical protein EOM28_03915 [Clostridia bacterium]|nr:hypothetical protein [Clostridia bacterium]